MRASEPSRPPVPIAGYTKQCGADDDANESGVNEDGDGEGKSQHFDHEEVAEGEGSPGARDASFVILLARIG